MASANEGGGDVSNGELLYYCYQCGSRVTPYPDLTCPECHSDFLELVPPPDMPSALDVFDSDGPPEEFDDMDSIPEIELSGVAERMQYLFNSSLITPFHLQGTPRQAIPPGFNQADVVTGPFEMDRVLAWFFENDSGLLPTAGLSEKQIKKIPVSLLRQEDFETKEACPICIEDYKLLEEVKHLTCEHIFHTECINSWLRVRATCPVCRKVVKVDKTLPPFGKVAGEHDMSEDSMASVDSTAGTSTVLNFSSSSSEASCSDEDDQNSSDMLDAANTVHVTDPPSAQYVANERNHSAQPSAGRRHLRTRYLYHPFVTITEDLERHLGSSEEETPRRAWYELPSWLRDGSARHDSTDLQNSSNSSSGDSADRHQSSNSSSSSVEDLSSIVPVLPPNVVLK